MLPAHVAAPASWPCCGPRAPPPHFLPDLGPKAVTPRLPTPWPLRSLARSPPLTLTSAPRYGGRQPALLFPAHLLQSRGSWSPTVVHQSRHPSLAPRTQLRLQALHWPGSLHSPQLRCSALLHQTLPAHSWWPGPAETQNACHQPQVEPGASQRPQGTALAWGCSHLRSLILVPSSPQPQVSSPGTCPQSLLTEESEALTGTHHLGRL